MLVFIDESGDPGFKVEKGSSPVFVLSMVIFDADEDAHAATAAIKAALVAQRVRSEWKFSKCDNDRRDAFFEAIAGLRFRTRAVVVDKALIYSHGLRTKPRQFYNYFTRMMMQHDGGALQGAKVIIDGSGDRAFKQALQSYLKRELGPGVLRKVSFKDSARDPLIQLADMTAGAIARSYSDRQNPGRWRAMLARNGQIGDVWDFR